MFLRTLYDYDVSVDSATIVIAVKSESLSVRTLCMAVTLLST